MKTAHLKDEMTGWRQGLHRIPEQGFDLPKTAARVAELLEGFGLEVHRGIGQSGVVGGCNGATARAARDPRGYGRAEDHRDDGAGPCLGPCGADACLRP